MRLPPITPAQFRKAFAEQPSLRRRIARGWIIVGALVALFAIVMAVAHYLYGVPVHDRNTGELSSPEQTLSIILALGGGGVLFVLLGILLSKWDPS